MNEQLSILGNTAVEDKKPASNAEEFAQHNMTKPKAAKSAKPKIAVRKAQLSGAAEEFYQNIVDGLKKFFKERNFQKGVVGLSGGVDSALTLKLAVDALGAKNVTALILPELGITRQENIDHAKILASYFGITAQYQPINAFLADYTLLPWKPNKMSLMNAKARIRMSLLYNFANSENALVLGTSNRSELLLGYGTKFGDLACDVEVIGGLYKTEVIMLADHVGLPPEIVEKTPSAELAPGQTDEAELGATYRDLDKVLMKLDLGIEGCLEHGMPASLVHKVFKLAQVAEHKTKLTPIITVQRPL